MQPLRNGCMTLPLAELIFDGAYRTIDLSPFGWQRVPDGKPYAERGII